MFDFAPNLISQALLGAFNVRLFVDYKDRIPEDAAVVVVSNHRSFMDAPVLIEALEQPVHIACHRYMGQIPVMREFVKLLGCFPLEKPEQRLQGFFDKATELLQQRQWVGIFPEGTQPMVQVTQPYKVGKFHRGFAHLAYRASVPNLVVLPVAIASQSEENRWAVPLRFLRLFDPTEPLFDRSGLHPAVIYHHVKVLVGRPYWITDAQRQDYQGKEGKNLVNDLNEYCRKEIVSLLREGYR
ncbi:MAG: lysophospholipid acyltransferase family protein [Cyanophyceae cyanobacterium]